MRNPYTVYLFSYGSFNLKFCDSGEFQIVNPILLKLLTDGIPLISSLSLKFRNFFTSFYLNGLLYHEMIYSI